MPHLEDRGTKLMSPILLDSETIKEFSMNREMPKGFDDLKSYLSSPPILGKPDPGEELFPYLAASPLAIGAVLIQERDKI